VIPSYYYLIFSAILFSIGAYGALARRNAVLILISIELMLNAANINLIAFAANRPSDIALGQTFAIFAVVVGAAEIGVALATVLSLFRLRDTINLDKIDLLKW
jgi:NADH:ubiquinone oxidoreductase subunit K